MIEYTNTQREPGMISPNTQLDRENARIQKITPHKRQKNTLLALRRLIVSKQVQV
jgi:hypothetical protein